jgi:hypothetical protein
LSSLAEQAAILALNCAGPTQEHQPHRAASIAATSIFFMPIIASNARLASAPTPDVSLRRGDPTDRDQATRG